MSSRIHHCICLGLNVSSQEAFKLAPLILLLVRDQFGLLISSQFIFDWPYVSRKSLASLRSPSSAEHMIFKVCLTDFLNVTSTCCNGLCLIYSVDEKA